MHNQRGTRSRRPDISAKCFRRLMDSQSRRFMIGDESAMPCQVLIQTGPMPMAGEGARAETYSRDDSVGGPAGYCGCS